VCCVAGKWYGVAPVADSFVVNIGDLMQRWTNDRWVSTLHRVVNPAGQTVTNERRQSMAFFHNLNGDAVVETIPTCVTPDRYSLTHPITHSRPSPLCCCLLRAYGG
jgi:isopenicillin N synthase-like dioxygenase